MEEGGLEHKVEESYLAIQGYMVRCSCGASWSHPKNRTAEERDRIFTAHANYKRPLTKPD